LFIGVGGVTDGITARSYDHRPRPESFISYNCLGKLCDNVTYVVVCKCVLCHGRLRLMCGPSSSIGQKGRVMR